MTIRHETEMKRWKVEVRRLLSNRMILVGLIVVFIVTFISLAAPILSPYDPLNMNVMHRLKPPSVVHWFGTDQFGRDLLSRVLFGSRVSMEVGFSVVIITAIAGAIIGTFSAYYRTLDNLIMRIMDALMAFPTLLLAIAIVAALGPGIGNIIIALSVVYIPLVARVVRAVALVEREKVYIEAIKLSGARSWRIMFKHILPNCLSPFIVQTTFIFAQAIIVEASLSFLGAGIPAPNPSWGNIINDGASVIREAWWVTVFPGLFMMFTVLGLNLLGDGLRDQLDPSINKARQ
ncbi:MAG: ABC transporter permease [Desulfitobacteriaceae bacterium]